MSTGDELRLGKFGNQGQVNTDSLKGGVKREAAEKAGFGNIFDAFDDGNGVLTDNEINTLKQGITDSAKHGKDSIFSQNEAEEYIQNFNQNAQANNQKTLNDVNAQKLFDFLKFVEQQTKSVVSSTVDSDNNAVTKYKNELGQEVTEIIHQDTKTTEQVVVANGKEIRTFLNAEGKKEKEIETNQQTGAVMTTIYGSDGKTIKTKTVEEKSGKKTVTEYQTADGEQEAKPVKVTITNGITVEEQTLVNGELKTTHRIENKGKSNQKDIEIKYNENGRTETVTENGQTYTVEYIGSNRVITKKNGTTQDVTTENGQKKEVITTENSSDTTTNIYNLSDKKLSQTKVIKGKEYSVTYDGNGNTTGIVVQYGENAEKIAKKFGITKEALLKANGKNEGEDFKAGDTIIIPKELEADDKNLKGRKSSADAIKDQKRAEERARRREIARQRAIALDKQYRAAGLKNYEHKGEKFQYGNETYTVIGTMNNRARLMVKDSKGNICIASHDHKILKDSYVQLTTAYDKGQKVTMRNGQKVVVLNSRGDKHGRMIGLDEHGRQVVISGGKSKTDLSDRVVLDNSYVEASDVRDIVTTRIETAKDDNERKAVISQNRSYSSENIIRCKGKNGKVWYFDLTTGKAVNLTKQEAAAITRELDDAAGGMGTNEAQLAKANGAIVDPAVLAEINKYYESQGYTAGEYKSAYEAFLASEISDSEIYEANADLVNNNAILDQARRDEILLTNLTTFGNESANRIKAMRAIGTRTDYNNLQLSLAQHNRANGYNAHFKGQDALQTTLYNITNGNVAEIDAANRALIDSNETILTRDEIVRIQAEVGAMYLEKGDSRNATRSQDAEVLATMDNLTTADGQKIDVKSKAGRADLMIAGYGDFSDEEIAQEVIKYLKLADKNLNAVMDDLGAVTIGEGHEFDKVNMASIDHQEFEDYATKAHQLIKNFNILTIVKKEMGKEYSRIVSRIEFETSEKENLLDANSKKPPKINFSNMLLSKTTAENLSNEEYEQNMQLLNPIRAAVYSLEAQHLDAVDGEGWKLDFVNQLRQQMFLGTTRADVTNQYAMSKATLNKLELAAKGQLVDANGNKVSFEDAVEQLTGKTVQDLQSINQEYVEHQAYGEMGVDLTVGLVTMVIPVPGLGVGKLVSVGGKLYKVAQVVNAAKNEYKLVNVAISGMEVAAKMKAVQYTIDRTNIATSVSGNTLENRGAVEDKSDEVAMYSAAGVVAGGATSVLSSRISSTLGRATVNTLGFGADLASSAYISQQFHGGNFTDYLRLTNEDGTLNTGNILNTVMTGVGYGQGLRSGVHAPELPPVRPQEVEIATPKLDAISKNAKPRTVYIKTEEKFKAIKEEVDAKLKTITSEADLDALKQQVGVIQNRDMRQELERMIEAKRPGLKKPVVETPVEDVKSQLISDPVTVAQDKLKNEVLDMLKHKISTGKGLNETEFLQVKEYISNITDKRELDQLELLLSGRKMTLSNKKELRQLLNEKRQTVQYTTEFEPEYQPRRITGEDIDNSLGINDPEMQRMNDYYRELEAREFEPVYERPKTDAQTIDNRLNPDNPELRALNERYAQGQSLLELNANIEDAIFGLNMQNATHEYVTSIKEQINTLGQTNPELKTILNDLLDEALKEIELEASNILKENTYIQRTHRQGANVKSAEESAAAFLENLEYINLERENLYIDRTFVNPSGKSAAESAAVFEQQLPIIEKINETRAQLSEPSRISATDIDARLSNPELQRMRDYYVSLEQQEAQIVEQITKIKAQMKKEFHVSVEEIDARMLAENPTLQVLNNRYRALEQQEALLKQQVESLKSKLRQEFSTSATEIDARLSQRTGDYEDLVADLGQREIIGERARRELASERTEMAAVEREQAYIDRTYGTTPKSAAESADVFEVELARRDAVAKAREVAKQQKMQIAIYEQLISDIYDSRNLKDLQKIQNRISAVTDLAKRAEIQKQLDEATNFFKTNKIAMHTDISSGKEYEKGTYSQYLLKDELDKINQKLGISEKIYIDQTVFVEPLYRFLRKHPSIDFTNPSQLSKLSIKEQRELTNAIILAKVDHRTLRTLEENLGYKVFKNSPLENAVDIMRQNITPNVPAKPQHIINSFHSDLDDLVLALKSKKDVTDVSATIKEIIENNGGFEIPEENIARLKDVVNNQSFDNLSAGDKRLVMIATLLQDSKNIVSRTDTVFDVYNVAAKLGMTRQEADKLLNITKAGNFVNDFMGTTKSEKYVITVARGDAVLTQERRDLFTECAWDLKEGNNFELAKMIYQAGEPNGFTRNIDKLMEAEVQRLKERQLLLPQTSQTEILAHSRMTTIKGIEVPFVKASEIPSFRTFTHSPGGTTNHQSLESATQNLELFGALGDEHNVCTCYVGGDNLRVYGLDGYAFMMDIDPNKILVGYTQDLNSCAKTKSQAIAEFHRDTDEAWLAGAIPTQLAKSIGSKEEYVRRISDLRQKCGQDLSIENMKKYDRELAEILENGLLDDAPTSGAKFFSRAQGINEYDVYNPTIKGIITTDPNLLGSSILNYAKEHNLPIVLLDDVNFDFVKNTIDNLNANNISSVDIENLRKCIDKLDIPYCSIYADKLNRQLANFNVQ